MAHRNESAGCAGCIVTIVMLMIVAAMIGFGLQAGMSLWPL